MVAACLVGVLVGCAPAQGTTPALSTTTSATGSSPTAPLPDDASSSAAQAAPGAPPAASAAPEPGTAAQGALATALLLEVKGRAPKTGYARDQYGASWQDTDRNGCDQRNDVLDRDLTNIVHKPGTNDCVVLTGDLADPYSGQAIAFRRGESTSSAVQIDHVVALSDSWQKGAQQWDAATRAQFANDFRNLLAVDGPLNARKSDGDTATWLPPNKPFRCEYVARQVGVKYAYGLWVTQAERDAMVGVLSTCPDQPLPTGVAPPAAAAAAPAPAPAPAEPAPAPDAAPVPAPAEAAFENCAAARAAGAAPVHVGEPGYAAHLDGDGDGVGCE
ncbi:DUF1524 domain-containing protein [Pengzhenrongella frigida]|uniref:DUF1524 domain-containing protein n=1 Tax=Pengzhenrongella frigida TaxID=1259133 RepID=A0A4Q5N0Z9_9MICO|nr:DUF1524 domain-containing protein [Cellulomonas sp. HLT2-17]